VNNLLDFSRIEAGRLRVRYVPTDLSAATAELAGVFRSAVEKAGLRLVVDTPLLPEPVYVDREMWEKVVLNLVSNAFKFTFEGEIAVRLHAESGHAVLSVRDTGTGIPEADLPHVFERFHRVEGARGRTIEGTGIGLALVQELVRLHGGEVRVESTVGQGTAFTVTIPLGTAHLPEDRIAGAPAQEAITTGAEAYVDEALGWLPGDGEDVDAGIGDDEAIEVSSGRPAPQAPRVLVADDNADMRAYVRRLLGAHYDVEVVADGEAALAAAHARVPDLVLSDVMMPRLDGFGLLRALRADARTREVPVVLLSARAGEEARIEGLEAGADDYLVKPFSARELTARVAATLELARVRREAAEREKALRAETEAALSALRVTEQRLREVFQRAPAIIATLRGPDHVFESANPLYLQLVGHRDVLGRTVVEALPEVVEQGFIGLLDQVYRTGEPFIASEMPVRLDRNGTGVLEEGFFNFVYQPLFDPDGSVSGIFAHAVDVTDQVHARQRIEELYDEVRALNETLEARVAARTAELERANAALRRSNRELQDFAYVASHDLQEPLRKIATFADLLRMENGEVLDEDGLSYVQRMQDAARRMSELLRDLLAFSRVTTHAKPFRRTDLNTVLSEVLSDLEVNLAEVNGHVETGQLPEIEADPTQMRQLFQNLIGNALKFRHEGGVPEIKVRVAPGQADETVVIEVQDNGIGFEEKYLNRIFAPFQRLHGNSVYPGTGMGL
ncbi:MAG TPA: ATP-binding protein, partial [Rhodothermales bacterium]|nr:ATP-binding protein [Rhodothermales bacterium]